MGCPPSRPPWTPLPIRSRGCWCTEVGWQLGQPAAASTAPAGRGWGGRAARAGPGSDRGGTLAPPFIGPGFYGDRPAPAPHPTPLAEPAAIAQFLAVAGPAAADQSAWRDLAEGGSGGRGGGG